MSFSIGKHIGGITAHLEYDLYEDANDEEAMRKLALTSEIFRNFSMGGLPGFPEEFGEGYEAVVAEYRKIEGRAQAEFERSRTLPPTGEPKNRL